MKNLKGIFYFLLINALVSGLTTLVVLWYWEMRSSKADVPAVTAMTVIVMQPLEAIPNESISSGAPDPGTDPSQTPEPSAEALEIQYYQVQPGDNLSTIAVLFKVDLKDLMQLNEIEDPNSLYAGQVLKIPGSPLPTFTPELPTNGSLSPSPTLLPSTPTPTRTRDLSPGQLAIEAVLGVDVLELEQVKIVHASGGAIDLEGWQLVESDGQAFTFPRLELFAGGFVYVNTRFGTNSPLQLYWGQPSAVWQVGELVILRDEQGVQRASFRIP